jgi:hypothetical protein
MTKEGSAISWLVWRQYRAQAAIALVLLAGFAAVMLTDGVAIASHWHAEIAACSGHSACLRQLSPLASQAVADAVQLVGIGVPAVLGVLWGAPLVAHELESRTSDFSWAQSVTRTRWLAVRTGWLLLAAAVWSGVVTSLVTWWSGPDNALDASAFRPGQFDIQGIVPVGYAVFAMALGIASGTVARRTLPAIAAVLGGFVAVRLVIADFLRPHYIAAVTTYYNLTSSYTPPGSAWLFRQGAISSSGQFAAQGWGDVYPLLAPACQRIVNTGSQTKSGSTLPLLSCMQAHGWRGIVTYQPASRYWQFQGIETGICVLLAAALIAVTFVIIRKRDA